MNKDDDMRDGCVVNSEIVGSFMIIFYRKVKLRSVNNNVMETRSRSNRFKMRKKKVK